VANTVSFLTQKILIQDARDRKDRAENILFLVAFLDLAKATAGNTCFRTDQQNVLKLLG